MPTTSIELFRAGNKTHSTLTRVRTAFTTPDALMPDVMTINGEKGIIVVGGQGGISTFDRIVGFHHRTWWHLPAGSPYDCGLILLYNDRGNHWSWQPRSNMLLATYIKILAAADKNFVPCIT